FPTAVRIREDPAVAEMNDEQRPEKDGRKGQRNPARLNTEQEQQAADDLPRDCRVGEPCGQPDRDEELRSAVETIGDDLEHDTMGQEQDAECEAEHQCPPIGRGRFGSGRSLHSYSPSMIPMAVDPIPKGTATTRLTKRARR